MDKKIMLLDGAAGTTLWELAEKNGIERAPVWKYNIEHPELVLELHRRYIEAGCDFIQTNTFSVNAHSVKRSSDYTVAEVVESAVKLAKKAVEGKDIKVYLSLGPLATLLEPYGKLTKAETHEIYTELVSVGAAAGAEYVMLETFMDLEMMRIAAEAALPFGLPVICSMTFEKRKRTMMGNTIQQIVDTLVPMGISGIGMNCSCGPVQALDIIKDFHTKTDLPLYYKPNSGMGDCYDAVQFAREVQPALEYVSFVGGCCGCDDSYIKELGKLLCS